MSENSSTPSQEADDQFKHGRSLCNRFGVAFRGIRIAVRSEVNFTTHFFIAAIAILAGALLGLSSTEWCFVVLCIAIVLSAELFNTAVERTTRAITRDENPDIRDALDIASGAVLVVALGAALLGVIIFGVRIVDLLSH